MKSVVVGVMGHVDHGKTALVKALTGTDTDRLKEEKERGISIVLGFAHLATPKADIELVDIPGHERFVRVMVSGATGIDAMLLVVAANEGIKPQTREHVEIAALLGIRRGVIAISKCDLVSAEAAHWVADEARRLAADHGIGDAPVVFTSAAAGQGITDLAARLLALPLRADERGDDGFFYLPIDRVFTARGFGTVITGTLRRGRLSVGDVVELAPGGRRAQIRGLQIHNRPVEAAEPGRRVAVNLRHLKKSELTPGQAIVAPNVLATGRWLDAELTLLGSAPRALATGERVRVLVGTAERAARLRLLDRDALPPGEAALVQLHCRDDLAVPARERFILRTESPARTIGGGRVLGIATQRRRRHDATILASLRFIAQAGPRDIVRHRLAESGYRGCGIAEMARLVGCAPSRVTAWAGEIGAEIINGTAIDAAALAMLRGRILAQLDDFRRRHPREAGMAREQLRLIVARELDAGIFRSLIARMSAAGELVHDQGMLQRAHAEPAQRMPSADIHAAGEVERLFRAAGLTPPDLKDAIGSDPQRQWAVRHLLRSGALVRTVDRVQRREIIFHRTAIVDAKRRLAAQLPGPQGFPASAAGKALGISRKYCIPLLEHLDTAGFTRRQGDLRVVAAPVAAATDAAARRSPEAAMPSARRR